MRAVASTITRQDRATVSERAEARTHSKSPSRRFHGEPARGAGQASGRPGRRRPRRSRSPGPWAPRCRCRPRPRRAPQPRRTGTERHRAARTRSGPVGVVSHRQGGGVREHEADAGHHQEQAREDAGQAHAGEHAHQQHPGPCHLDREPRPEQPRGAERSTVRPLTAFMAMIPAAFAPNTRLKVCAESPWMSWSTKGEPEM